MTGPCSGAGVGTPKPGFSELAYISPFAIGGALASLSGWAGAAVGATIGALSYDLTTFCPDGPPAMPTFTAGDIAALLAPIPTPGRPAAVAKFNDFLGNLFWPTLCDCSSGTSTLGSPSTFPADGPQQIDSSETTPICTRVDFVNAAAPQQVALPNAFQSGSFSTTDTPLPLPSSAYWWTLDATALSSGAAHFAMDVTLQAKNASGTNLSPTLSGTIAVAAAPGGAAGPLVLGGPMPAGATTWHAVLNPASATITDHVNLSVKIYCGGAPGQQLMPCCPPDASTQAILDQILQMVTLVQRQAAPFSYVYGDNHAGLTGHGSFAVSGLLGVAVDVTTLPGSYGVEVGSPDTLFDLGYVNLGTTDGWTSSRRIDHDGTLFVPSSGGLYTAVGYSLSAGVEVAIRELVREP